MDPRVEIGAADLQLQTDLSMACYRAYLRAEPLRQAVDAALEQGGAGTAPERRSQWTALRGAGAPRDGDILYGSIYEVGPEQETIVGLQTKLLFMLNLLQSADARPTPQAVEAVRRLDDLVPALERRWAAAR